MYVVPCDELNHFQLIIGTSGSFCRIHFGHFLLLYPVFSYLFMYFHFIYLFILYISILIHNQQLILGVPAYGRSWTLAGSASSPGAAAAGAGPEGQFTRESGNLSFFECCLAEKVL